MYRIVPEDLEVTDHPVVEELNGLTDFIHPLHPEGYAEHTYRRFASELARWTAVAPGFSRDQQFFVGTDRLHESKVYWLLGRELLGSGLFRRRGDWLVGPRPVVEQYMILLATEMADEEMLGLVTNSSPAWMSQAFFCADGRVEPNPKVRTPVGLAELLLRDFVPAKIADVSPRAIAEFRESTADSRRAFLDRLEKWSSELAQVHGPEVVRDRLEEMQEDLKESVQDYKRELRRLRAGALVGTGAVLTWLADPIMDVLGLDPHSRRFVSYGLLGVGLLWMLTATKGQVKQLAKASYGSYLISLENLKTQKGLRGYASELWGKFSEYISR